MKHVFSKIMLCSIALLMVSATWAQDIIVTTDAKKIEAKILEVSKSEIKYKKASNPDGPTFVLSTSEITTIIYSSGEVELYNKEQKVAAKEEVPAQPVVPSGPTVDENSVEILTQSGSTITAQITELKSNYIAYNVDGKAYTMPASQIKTVTFLLNGQVKVFNGESPQIEEKKEETYYPVAPKYVSRNGNTYYYDGKSMSGESYSSFLRHNCPEAYKVYQSGKNISIAGWTLLAVGVGLDLGSFIALMATPITPYRTTVSPAAFACSLIGLGCELACIPTLIVGYNKMHRSADVYNVSCIEKSKVKAYWSVNASQNGIGIAYNF